jgi:predicted TIM-barrel fold metal-dependent hydrolase
VLSHEVQRTLVVLIFSGVLERFPELKIVSAENEVGWLPFFLQKLDQAYEEYRYLYPVSLTLKPREYFRRQIFATFIDDAVGVAGREFIGVDNIMWSSDYPHTVSTWPHSREVVERDFKGVPEGEKRAIVRDNVARLYGLGLV